MAKKAKKAKKAKAKKAKKAKSFFIGLLRSFTPSPRSSRGEGGVRGFSPHMKFIERPVPLTRIAPDDASHRRGRSDLSPQAGRGEEEIASTDYRSANASLAPSRAKPAAKLRRSQAITPGREITRSRTDAAQRP